jgi:hypothetical protein
MNGNPDLIARSEAHAATLRDMLREGPRPLCEVLAAIGCQTRASVLTKLARLQERGEVRSYTTRGKMVAVEWVS